jgi:uncharacterized membrane protein
MYVPSEVFSAIGLLGTYGKAEEIVLAPTWISTIIPAFTNKRVVAGHPTFTDNKGEKEQDIAAFYSFQNPSTAGAILTKYHVSFVWIESIWVPPEPFIGSTGLTPVYSNASVSLYRVKQ